MINIEEATRARRGYKVLFKDSEGYMRRGAFVSKTTGGKLLIEVRVSAEHRRRVLDYLEIEPLEAEWESLP